MADAPQRPAKGLTGTVGLIVAVVVLLVLEGGLVAGVFLSPSFGSKLEAKVAAVDRAWSGTKGHPGLRTRIADGFRSAYDGWIAPMFSSSIPAKGSDAYAGCVKCHKDYASQRQFSTVYMDHPLHAQLGVSCNTCHPDTQHPSPPLPLESVCAKCHQQVNTKGQCDLCHPPASLPHFYQLGAPRQGPVQCSTCHPNKVLPTNATTPLVHIADFTGNRRTICLQCHTVSNCEYCHQTITPVPGSPHPSNWLAIHPQAADPYGGQNDCYTCHTMEWCADKCHAVTNGQAPPLLPLPSASPPS